jgi:hypothetical protein
MVWGSNPGGGKILHVCPAQPWGPPSLLYNGYRIFPRGKAAWVWCPLTPPSSAEVKERVELYLYSPSGPSWPDIGWPLALTLPYIYITCIKCLLTCIYYIHIKKNPKYFKLSTVCREKDQLAQQFSNYSLQTGLTSEIATLNASSTFTCDKMVTTLLHTNSMLQKESVFVTFSINGTQPAQLSKIQEQTLSETLLSERSMNGLLPIAQTPPLVWVVKQFLIHLYFSIFRPGEVTLIV